MGYHYVGAFGYADDIILLCPSLQGMREMVKTCEDYATQYNILFNGKKSVYLVFGNYKYNVSLTVKNEKVSRSESALHLGHFLNTKNTNNEMTEYAINQFHKSYHSFLSRFGTCNTETKNRLFHQYCQSMYGSQLWLLSSSSVEKMCTQWRKAHRRILSVPSMTHCKLLPLIANNVSMETRLDCKYLAFYKAIATSRNSIVNYVARSKLHDHSSTMGKNMNHLMYKYNISVEDILQTPKKQMNMLCYQKWTEEIDAQSLSHANIIRELIKLKEGNLQLFFTTENFEFSYDAYNFIIYSLCVN